MAKANTDLAKAANRGIDALQSRGMVVPKIIYPIANLEDLTPAQLDNWRRGLEKTAQDDPVTYEALGGDVAVSFLKQYAPSKGTKSKKETVEDDDN